METSVSLGILALVLAGLMGLGYRLSKDAYKRIHKEVMDLYQSKGIAGVEKHPQVRQIRKGHATIDWSVASHHPVTERYANIGFWFDNDPCWTTVHVPYDENTNADIQRFILPLFDQRFRGLSPFDKSYGAIRRYIVLVEIDVPWKLPFQHEWILLDVD